MLVLEANILVRAGNADGVRQGNDGPDGMQVNLGDASVLPGAVEDAAPSLAAGAQ